MFSIEKSFGFCYGHRVWNQTLDASMSCNSMCKCRHLHGHQGKVTIIIEAEDLTDGMVMDFNDLKFFKQWLDQAVDHKFIIDVNDPAFKSLVGLDEGPETDRFISELAMVAEFSALSFSSESAPVHVNEITESWSVVNFVPTSENLAKHMCGVIRRAVDAKMPGNKFNISVKFQETPSSVAIYHSKRGDENA